MPERIAPAPIDYAALAKDMPTSASKPAEKPAAPAPAAAVAPVTTEKPADNVEGNAPSAEKPAEVPAEGPFKKGFEQLTKAQAQFRAERDAAKHGLALARVVNPVQAAALEKAMASGNATAAMQALGFSYADVAAELARGGKPVEKAAEAKPTGEPEAKDDKSSDPEIEQLKEWRRQTLATQQKTVILNGIKTVVTGAAEKYKMVAALEDFEGVQGIIDKLWDPEAKSFIGGVSGVEVIAIAAEEYERKLRDGEIPLTKKQWEKLQNLTPAASSASTAPEATRERPGNAPVSAAKTLTNKTGAPAAPVAARPATPDYESLARELP